MGIIDRIKGDSDDEGDAPRRGRLNQPPDRPGDRGPGTDRGRRGPPGGQGREGPRGPGQDDPFDRPPAGGPGPSRNERGPDRRAPERERRGGPFDDRRGDDFERELDIGEPAPRERRRSDLDDLDFAPRGRDPGRGVRDEPDRDPFDEPSRDDTLEIIADQNEEIIDILLEIRDRL